LLQQLRRFTLTLTPAAAATPGDFLTTLAAGAATARALTIVLVS
jgi:hypothetical protein